jgi:ubiquinone/menaquinone biosynthesis C-methylase UbiE
MRVGAPNDAAMAWYDTFARFYDTFLDRTYRAHREAARACLALEPGMTVVDVGCGTGASFAHLVSAVGQHGRVIGADASAGMLRKAAARVRRNGWQNVSLVEVTCDHQSLMRQVASADRLLFFLSLSVIPRWEEVLSGWLDILVDGGKAVIADVHNARPGPYARLVELIARASLTREPWRALEARTQPFTLAWQPSSWVLGGQFFLASGTRRSTR